MTPTQLQIIVMFPWRFSDLTHLEQRDSFFFARVIAFASTATLSAASCRICVGEPVVGFTQPTSGDSRSAQLVGWHTCDLNDWQLMAGNTLPPSPWDLCSDTPFVFLNGFPWFHSQFRESFPLSPQLSAMNFVYTRLPRVLFTFIAAPAFPDTLPQPGCQLEDAIRMERNVDAAQQVAYYPSSVAQSSAAAPPPRGRSNRDASIARPASRRRNVAAKARITPPVVGGAPVRQLGRDVSDHVRRRRLEYRRVRVSLNVSPPAQLLSPGGNPAVTPEERDAARQVRLDRRSSPANSAASSVEPPEALPVLGRDAILAQHLGDFMSVGSVPSSSARRYDI